jgi:hypothetical protein
MQSKPFLLCVLAETRIQREKKQAIKISFYRYTSNNKSTKKAPYICVFLVTRQLLKHFCSYLLDLSTLPLLGGGTAFPQ